MSDSMDQHYRRGDVKGVLEQLRVDLEGEARQPNLLLRGPLAKTKYTYDLEKLFRYILYENVEITPNKEGELIATLYENGQSVGQINITETMKYANPNHIVLSKADENRYLQYIKHQSHMQPMEANRDKFPTEEYFNIRDPKGELAGLDYSEKLAINIYTQESCYGKMNDFLRGRFKIDLKRNVKQQEQQLKDSLVNSIMAISGLNKVANTAITASFRNETIFSDDINNDRIRKATHPDSRETVTLEQGFISTSAEKPSDFNLGIPGAAITFTGLVGKNIRALSVSPGEREFLIPPTQVSWKGYKKEGETHFFHAQPVTTLTGLPEEALTAASPETVEEHETTAQSLIRLQAERIKLHAERVLKMVIDIKQDYAAQEKKWLPYAKRTEQMDTLIRHARGLLSNDDPAEVKLEKIQNILERVKQDIATEKRRFFGLFKSESRLGKSVNKILNELPEKPKRPDKSSKQ